MKENPLQTQKPETVNEEIVRLLRTDGRIKKLCVVKTMPYVWQALVDWGAIFCAVWASEASGWIVYGLACLVIAGRQHAFFALSHEAAHNRISTNKRWNDVFSNVLFSYPILFDTGAYRQNHLKHHTYLNSDADPDWARKVHLPQWQFPLSWKYTAKTYPAFLLWYGPKEWFLIMMRLAKVLPLNELHHRDSLRRVSIRAAYYGVIALALTHFSAWTLFAKYWALPLVFVFPTLQRIRSAAEHFGLARTNDLNNTRNVMAPWLERIFLGPHNLHYHLDHHLIATVPFYNLPELHRILLENATYRAHCHENTSYVRPVGKSMLWDLYRGDPQAHPAESQEVRRAA